jgi:hypothetical protein
MHDLLLEPSDDEIDLNQPSNLKLHSLPSSILFGTRVRSTTSKRISRDEVQFLTDIFIANVDPLVKILHIPSLRKLMRSVYSDSSERTRSRGEDVVIFAVYFSAVTSMTDEECLVKFRDSRQNILAKRRFDLEKALDEADFTKNAEMATLQALVLFLVRIFPLIQLRLWIFIN